MSDFGSIIRPMRRILLALGVSFSAGLLSLAAAPAALAQSETFKQGFAAYTAGEFDRAAELWTESARAGDAESQNLLALLYVEGQGVERDMSEAIRLYTAAAEQNHIDAQYALAVIAFDGIGGVPRDLQTAVAWLQIAAKRGHVLAQFDLGNAYARGSGVSRDLKEAAGWFRKAADQGHPDAQFNLGVLRVRGDGLAADKARALEWFKSAGAQGHGEAQFNAGVMLSTGDENVPADPAAGLTWLKKASDQGVANAQLALGNILLSCTDTAPELAKNEILKNLCTAAAEDAALSTTGDDRAARLILSASEGGQADAQMLVAELYAEGRGLDQNPVQALSWLMLAEERGRQNPALRASLGQSMTEAQKAEAVQLATQRKAGAIGPQLSTN